MTVCVFVLHPPDVSAQPIVVKNYLEEQAVISHPFKYLNRKYFFGPDSTAEQQNEACASQ